MTGPREWDAETYNALPLPHVDWGGRTLGRLPLRGDETVMDAGAGTGRDTAALLDRLPDGHVVAVDGSQRMLEQLRANLGDRLDRVSVIHADLTEPLPVTPPVDAVMSVAAFHWIHDHTALFANLAGVMRPGAWLSSDCGGRGNIAAVTRAIEAVAGPDPDAWEFADVADTERALRDAGFTDIWVQLRPDPLRLDGPDQLHAYLATVVLGAHLDGMTAEDGTRFVHDVAAHLEEPVLDYVRLEVTARRA